MNDTTFLFRLTTSKMNRFLIILGVQNPGEIGHKWLRNCPSDLKKSPHYLVKLRPLFLIRHVLPKSYWQFYNLGYMQQKSCNHNINSIHSSQLRLCDLHPFDALRTCPVVAANAQIELMLKNDFFEFLKIYW